MKTRFYSYKIGNISKGCKLCVLGKKSVLFITGMCSKKPLCYYCSLSNKKIMKDVIYINEWSSSSLKDLKKEIELCRSKGVGITGGDPLAKLERTIKYIKYLKKTFGKEFHIHLYTPLVLVNKPNLKKLFQAGLDEIRFHPDLDDDKLWNRIGLAKECNWKVGVEIPVIPTHLEKTKRLIDYIKDKVDFLNLNELEFADNKINKLSEKGFKPKDNLSYAVKESHDTALKLLKFSRDKIKHVHYCTAKLKDKVQLKNRITLRAKSIKKAYDVITEDGTLFRGAIYRRKDLSKLRQDLIEKHDIPKKMIEVDKKNKRLLTAAVIIDDLKEKLKKDKLNIAIVEEYPTHDLFPVMINYL